MDSRKDFDSKEEIIESWVKLYTGSLLQWAQFKTSDKECAEDLVQDTFLAAFKQLASFNGNSSPKTWLLAILNNKIKSYYRNKYKILTEKAKAQTSDSALFNQFFDQNDHWKNHEKPSDWGDHQIHLLDDPEFNHILASCMNGLPEAWRLAISLKYLEQKKGELICQELDISPTNFWQQLHRAKLQLRKCLSLNWFKA